MDKHYKKFLTILNILNIQIANLIEDVLTQDIKLKENDFKKIYKASELLKNIDIVQEVLF